MCSSQHSAQNKYRDHVVKYDVRDQVIVSDIKPANKLIRMYVTKIAITERLIEWN